MTSTSTDILPDGWNVWHRRTLGGRDYSCLEHACGATMRLTSTLGEVLDHECP